MNIKKITTQRTYTCFYIVATLFLSISLQAQQTVKLVILHTNDTHSQVEPTEKSALKTSDMGGYARRMGEIAKIRNEEKNVLLLDAGDFSQGTPYFNFFNGRVEIDALNRMRYDAGTLGNHEFDNGVDTLAMVLSKANFPILSANYDVSATPLKPYIKPYILTEINGIKIGIMALNVQPKGLITENNYRGIVYNDPIKIAKETSALLKKKMHCDIIICLSHLGGDSTSVDVNDFTIAHQTKYIDVIIGGHSHTMLENIKTNNAAGKKTVIAQVGKSGLYMGRIDLLLEKRK